ncbi:MAG: hypothetical protein AB1805_03080 [Nitrospirota bacterium]
MAKAYLDHLIPFFVTKARETTAKKVNDYITESKERGGEKIAGSCNIGIPLCLYCAQGPHRMPISRSTSATGKEVLDISNRLVKIKASKSGSYLQEIPISKKLYAILKNKHYFLHPQSPIQESC